MLSRLPNEKIDKTCQWHDPGARNQAMNTVHQQTLEGVPMVDEKRKLM